MATDSSSAIKWGAQQCVTTKGLVLSVHLWIELLERLDVAQATYKWIKVPGHVQLEGNERADALAKLIGAPSFCSQP